MGDELTVFEATGPKQHVWANIPRLIIGAAGWLRLNPDGRPAFDVRPSAIMKKYYGEMILSLEAAWNVRTFFATGAGSARLGRRPQSPDSRLVWRRRARAHHCPFDGRTSLAHLPKAHTDPAGKGRTTNHARGRQTMARSQFLRSSLA